MVAVASLAPALRPSPNAERREPNDYIHLVRKVAFSVARRLPARIDVRDLISAGTLGLIDAIAKYDARQNDNFEAYAEIRVRGAILDELRALDWVPRSVRQKSHALDHATRSLEANLGRAPSEEELADSMDLSIDAYHSMVGDVRATALVPLDEVLTTSVGGPSTDDEDGALELLCRRATAHALASTLETMPERDRLVLNLYYLEGLKLKEIGELLGVTESRVCQLHGQAIARLKARLDQALS